VKKLLPLLVLFLVALYPLSRLIDRSPEQARRAEEQPGSMLPTTASDVIIVEADFSSLPGDILDEENLALLKEVDRLIAEMPGLRGFSSLLSANVVKADQDEILSLPFIPEDVGLLPAVREQYRNYPEIRPYLSPDFQTAVFYLEPGLSASSQAIVVQLELLQREMQHRHGLKLDFTGLRPIRTYLERYLTGDLLRTLPLMFLLISLLYYVGFGSWRVVVLAWIVKIVITGFAFACYQIFIRELSPMLVLIPTFAFGLLSDYLIHMLYHLQGRSGLESWRSARKYLTVPLSLTAVTSVVGFLSLLALGGGGHVLIAVTISVSIATVYLLALWWLPLVAGPWLFASGPPGALVRTISRALQRAFARLFRWVFMHRRVVLPVLLAAAVAAAASVFRLNVQPYPLQQFPESSTIVRAEHILNEHFSGTVPFRLDIEADQSEAFTRKESLVALEQVHNELGENPDVGFQHSILSVVKRINYYFHESDPRHLSIPAVNDEERFSALIQQYLLFYSASASPVEYESLIDSSFSVCSLHGILRYRGTGSLDRFLGSLQRIEASAPSQWKIGLSGPLLELMRIKTRMERNWIITFGISSILIFLTVLFFFRSIKMSLISLVPSLCILLVLAGLAPVLNIQVDEYTIIIVGISTGLTIDYTIHMLNTIKKVLGKTRVAHFAGDPSRYILSFGYALVRSGGLPVFYSFLTTIFAFSTLLLSSFSGAVHFALLFSLAIGSAFFVGVFVLPLFFVPRTETATAK
jgi:predicted RND superfamily exporter protein